MLFDRLLKLIWTIRADSNSMIYLQVPICCLLWAAVAYSATYADSAGGAAIPLSSLKVDEQLYSRQIFVYGKNAQQSLSSSHVIVKGSNKPLAAEIVKNLALAGVGKITVISGSHSSLDAASLGSSVSLTGGESIAEYARSLNPLIAVGDIDEEALDTIDRGITVAVCAERSLKDLLPFFTKYHSKGIKHIGCCVRGVSGVICDDFMGGFEVLDADGEFSREIPLLSASVVGFTSTTKSTHHGDENFSVDISAVEELSPGIDGVAESSGSAASLDRDLMSTVDIRVECIDEERLGLGIGDYADVTLLDSISDGMIAPPVGPYEVIRVDNSKSAVLRIRTFSDKWSEMAEQLLMKIKAGRATVKKTKVPQLINHTSLADMLEKGIPTFVPTNGCLSDKKDRVLSLCLLAAVRALDTLHPYSDIVTVAVKPTQAELQAFKDAVIAELILLGVKDPVKSIKEGGVGMDILEYITERYLYSARGSGQCPATVSVIGALAAQEVIKGITQVHVPISQFLMFESLDSVLLPLHSPNPSTPTPASGSASALDVTADMKASADICMTASVYGEEVTAELTRLKVFIVGSGAIGCELLKTFALLGVGAGVVSHNTKEESSEGSGSLWHGLDSGGIVLADMDSIERSNLNRQLLFREKHVGSAKAEVAAETIKQINPRMRVKAAQNKVCTETEAVFNSEFWTSLDVVATALDNVDARRYVDAQCVTYGKWMVDSGTLGTKGNTQVVVPFVSESYSSSSDPPEEDIPLCTLKSFPYQPEHCVAWARNKFDQMFSSDLKMLKTCFEMSELIDLELSDTESSDAVASSLAALLLSSDELYRLQNALRLPQVTPLAALQWAVRTFDDTYRVEAESLLKEHPLEEIDENGILFWGGSRRRPIPLIFDPTDPTHRSFVLWAAVLRGRVCGMTDLRSPSDTRLLEAFQELGPGSPVDSSIPGVTGEAVLGSLLVKMGAGARAFSLSSLCPEEFEKDDADLGHVDFATVAANLRCRVYGLKEVDRLEVQKIAGRIVPALATTTTLVAGLASLEIIKIATENILKRREKPVVSESENTRIMKKFRNSFVNVARPLLAFAQPVEAETFSVNNQMFNSWSFLEAPKSISKLTVSALEEFLLERCGAHLQSVSVRDFLLYADFLPGSDELLDLPLDTLIKRMEASGKADRSLESEDPRSVPGDSDLDTTLFNSETHSFIDLEVVCVDGDGSDLQLPPVRVYLKPRSSRQKKESSSRGRKVKLEKMTMKSALSDARDRMLKWAKKR